MQAMPTIADAASEIRVRRDMIDPFSTGQFVLRTKVLPPLLIVDAKKIVPLFLSLI
jgi:hypothetical protein